MDRTIPNPGNEEIELYMRTYYSLLRSSGEVEVRSLEETHSGLNASLHRGADTWRPGPLSALRPGGASARLAARRQRSASHGRLRPPRRGLGL